MSEKSRYTTDQLCDKFDDLRSQVSEHTQELKDLDNKIDIGNEAALDTHKDLDGLITQVRYKTIQMFKEVFGDPDSKRRGLAVSHRETDKQVNEILGLIKQGRAVYLVSAALTIGFMTAVYNGVITLDFLVK